MENGRSQTGVWIPDRGCRRPPGLALDAGANFGKHQRRDAATYAMSPLSNRQPIHRWFGGRNACISGRYRILRPV